MKFNKKQLARIVREEYQKIYGPRKDKTVRLTEAQIRRTIREELEECEGMQVDKHGSLSNPAQMPLDKEEEVGMGMMGLSMYEDELYESRYLRESRVEAGNGYYWEPAESGVPISMNMSPGSEDKEIWVLRSETGKPHLTATVRDGRVVDARQRGNRSPTKHAKYISALERSLG